MSTIINDAHRQRDLVNQKIDQGVAAVNKNVGTPVSDSILNLIVREDSLTQRLSTKQPLSEVQGKFNKLKAGLNNYDNAMKKLDGLGIKGAARVYQGITVGLAPIARSVVGQVVVKALATFAAGLVRLIAKVAEYALRILPYIAIPAAAAAGILAGIHSGAFVAAGLYVAAHTTSFAIGTAATFVAVSLLSNHFRTSTQGKQIKEIKENVGALKNALESTKGFAQRSVEAVRKHKGKILGAVLLTAAGAAIAYNGVPEVVAKGAQNAFSYLSSFFKPVVIPSSLSSGPITLETQQVVETFEKANRNFLGFGKTVSPLAVENVQEILTTGTEGVASMELAKLVSGQ